MDCDNCNEPDSCHFENGYSVCHNCGYINYDEIHLEDYQYENTVKKKIYYKRLNYFIEILKLVCCIKLSINGLSYVIDFCKRKYKRIDDEYENLINLKIFLKQNNFSKYLKYIYILYFKLFDIKLIEITHNEYTNVINDFKIFNHNYSQKTDNKRNILNYQFLIFKFFEKNNINCLNYLILPYTNKKLLKIYNEIIQ